MLGEPTRRRRHALARRASAFFFPPPLPPAPPVIPPAPPYARRPLPDHVQARAQPISADDFLLVRPYLVDHERRTESRPDRSQQRCAVGV
ncbi:hypothetical protein [Streptomyces catenulae]|uniref:Uncharacterized protein n=1 Tax=Streptomyces catenulae TaxID=66875 RepID=A0ABV2YXK4_9ACTN